MERIWVDIPCGKSCSERLLRVKNHLFKCLGILEKLLTLKNGFKQTEFLCFSLNFHAVGIKYFFVIFAQIFAITN